MLQTLTIHNYVLIKELDISFHDGFSVVTGETGAGKSIILGAISLLLGQRADTRMISEGEKRCTIEAEFSLEGQDLHLMLEHFDIDNDGTSCIIRRELTVNGKSRAFINDTPVALPVLREFGERLIDIHSQHKNLLLTTEDFQIQVLDTIANNSKLFNSYSQAYAHYNQACKRLTEARAALMQSEAEEDYLRFQLQQLDDLQLESGRQAEMEREQQILEHAEEIKDSLWEASCTLQGDGHTSEGAIAALRTAARQLATACELMPSLAELSERFESATIELRDIASSIDSEAEGIDIDSTRLDAVNEWLSALYSAMKKHHVSDEESLIALRDELRERIQSLENSDEHINTLTREREAAYASLVDLATKLTLKRQQAAIIVQNQMQALLAPLGIPNVQFKIDITANQEPCANGNDQVLFLFSANQGSPLRPIAEVASGGEISRVMLSLKTLLSGARKLPTIIFDEIDTGVSGNIAARMASMMFEMAQKGCQVISITHLPQIAALGQHHYRVYKTEEGNATKSSIEELDLDERVTEIAHMLSGAEITQAAIDNAHELLKASKSKT